MQTTVQEFIKELISRISSTLIPIYSDIDHAKNIAWLIVQFVTSYTKAQLLMNSQINISQQQLKKIEEILYLHVEHQKPIQYLFGHVPFLDLDIKLKPGILIPRPETEYWCNDIIESLKKAYLNQELKSFTILDLCTGTGCIGLALAKAFPQCMVYAVDISSEACQLAQENAKRNDIKNIIILKSDVYKKVPKDCLFDIIVSNPPYISIKSWKKLEPMVKKWENSRALKAKKSGTSIIKKIIKEASYWLKPNLVLNKAALPQLILEMDDNQAKKISKLLKHYGFVNIIVKKDLSGMDRVIQASIKNKNGQSTNS